MKNRFLGFGIALVVILAFALTACGELEDDAPVVIDLSGSLAEEEGTPTGEGEVDFQIGEDDPDFQLMGWYWERQTYSDESFAYNFKNDGSVSVVHCCGDEFHYQFSYFLDGDILFTYGSEMGSPEAEAGKITFTEKNGVVSLIRESGTVFIRGKQASPVPDFRVPTYLKPKKPLGTWLGNNAEFIFSGNDELLISEGGSALRPGQYRYLAKAVGAINNSLAIWGPLADGETADVWRYSYGSFSQSSSTLTLTSLNGDGINYTLTRAAQ